MAGIWKHFTKGGSSKDRGGPSKRNAPDIPHVSVDKYSGRLKEIDGRERGPVAASARARRSYRMANPDFSSDATENLIRDSTESPPTIDNQTRAALEREMNEQGGNESPPTNSYRPNINVDDTNSYRYRASTHFNDTNCSYASGSQHGEEARNDPTNQPWEELTHAVDGGPSDPELLKGFLGHIAHSIWIGNDRNILGGFHQHKKLTKFKDYLNDNVNNVVNNSLLSHLPTVMQPKINMPLISAFVERWHPETNSFHLPFGEMTITLHDVHFLLGIPVQGRAVKVVTHSPEQIRHLLSTHMQMNDALVRANYKSAGFKRSTIEDALKAQTLPPHSHAVMYLLWLLGTSLFVDKSSTRVPAGFLPFLNQLEEVQTYAWGAAALANQYRQLGIASRIDCNQIDGCLSLVQMWIYKHFPSFESWNLGTVHQDQDALHLAYRSALDNIASNEVMWTPFGRAAEEVVPISQFRGIIHCLKITEAYMPDRVMRQFGYPQLIPQPLIQPIVVSRPPQPAFYKCSYPAQDSFENFQNVRCNFHNQALRVHYGYESFPNYNKWFHARTHRQVTRQQTFTRREHYRPSDMNPTVRIQWLGSQLARITEPNRRCMSQNDVFDILDEICEHFKDVIPSLPSHDM